MPKVVPKIYKQEMLMSALRNESIVDYKSVAKVIGVSAGTVQSWINDCDIAFMALMENKKKKRASICKQVDRLRAKGFTQDLACYHVGVATQTYKDYKKQI